MEQVYIIGSGGFASELTQYIDNNTKYSITGYFDRTIEHYNHYAMKNHFSAPKSSTSLTKLTMLSLLLPTEAYDLSLHTIQENRGSLSEYRRFTALLATHVFSVKELFCAHVTITSNAVIGNNFQANIYSYIAHDVTIGDMQHLLQVSNATVM